MSDVSYVIVSGSRFWNSDEHCVKIYNRLIKLDENIVIVHGGARGVDSITEAICQIIGLKTKQYLADWKSFKKSAGPIRNRKMLDDHVNNLLFVLAFHDNIEKSSGTKDMIQYAVSKKVYVELIT